MEANYLTIILQIVCGLALFVYSMNGLSENLKIIAGERLNTALDIFTRNVITGVLTGVVVTVLLSSSSLAIIMTIALVNAGAMTFRQSMGVVMGANIGTTVASQIIAFDIGEFAAIPLFIGLVWEMLDKQPRRKAMGRFLFTMGLVFFALMTMESAVEPLKHSDRFKLWIDAIEHPWAGVLAGAVITFVIQASSATVGMVISLAGQGLISLAAGIAVMLGAELGTCSDTLLATIGRGRSAIRTGVFHLSFNIITIVIGVLLIVPFTQLVLWVSGEAELKRVIANAHSMFNITGVLLFLPLVGPCERLLMRLVPDKVANSGFEK